ncbi:hypothetical protein OTK49_01295 [Vibrio coralliirubri]|uniref:hypothetical protein n=1 Tax=Vibrio coralliirubri TaxID=1516159 RepID=UPI002283AB3C|nr:hypothetical protein [Vibrio coralliirubri]MCY9861164.1 hypothetical protein [Vibrio coralliirubri]
MKVLTKVALGGLINRLPENVQLFPKEAQTEYLATQFIGEGVVWDSEYMHYKHGDPVEVSEWLKTFGIDKSFSPEFVIASVIELLMKFRHEGSEKFFELDGNVYKRAFHKYAEETQYPDLFKLPLRGEEIMSNFSSMPSFRMGYAQHADLAFYISRNPQDFSRFDDELEGRELMHLHVPYAEAELDEKLEAFIGMPCRFDGKDGVVQDAGVITLFKMDAKGAEAKQAAFMSMVSACAMAPVERRHPRVEVIDDNFYVYITVKGSLAFAVEIESTDFIEGQGVAEDVQSSAAWVEDLRPKRSFLPK